VETQAEPRFKKRLPCRLKVAGNSHAAMVLNLSRSGLFVQTSAGPPPGASVMIDLDVANRSDIVPIGGKVVWRRMVAPHLRTISQGGIGVRIESASEAYFRFLSDVAGGVPPATSPPAAGKAAPRAQKSPPEPPGTEFRVRIKQQGGPRSRTMVVKSRSEDEARRRALAAVGSGWVILELESSS
jgi:Tfp pilus assembly protein PilZ